jgi:hypothetical protein
MNDEIFGDKIEIIADPLDGFYLSEHFQIEDLFIPDENPSDKWDGFSKMTYCPNDKKWCRDYS